MVAPTRKDYEDAYSKEWAARYPAVDNIERHYGFAIGKAFLEKASWLACPVKVNPPNWQHGRLVYSVLRNLCSQGKLEGIIINCLDIGTAKGFSALCAAQALSDAGATGRIWSIDVIDPNARTSRNLINDIDGPSTLPEILAPWRGLTYNYIFFVQSTGVIWLKSEVLARIHFAFIDGKHTYDQVSQELKLISAKQHQGDVVICDDVQVDGVHKAVGLMTGLYDINTVSILSNRKYAILRRR